MNLNKNSIHIVYASANILMQQGMKILCGTGGVEKFHQAYSTEQLDQLMQDNQYDLLIYDWNERLNFNHTSLNNLLKHRSSYKVLIISNATEETAILSVLEKGVEGFLTYTCDEDEIIHALFAVAKGDKFYCNKVLDIVLNKHLYGHQEENCAPTNLSERETEIAKLLAGGLTNKEAAEKLHLSPHTIHTHRKNIMKKLGVRSASELTITCIRLGIIEA